jgi:hypothetical protein
VFLAELRQIFVIVIIKVCGKRFQSKAIMKAFSEPSCKDFASSALATPENDNVELFLVFNSCELKYIFFRRYQYSPPQIHERYSFHLLPSALQSLERLTIAGRDTRTRLVYLYDSRNTVSRWSVPG